MIEINLLPKDYLKRSSNFSVGKKEIYGFAGAVALVALLIVVTLYQMQQVRTLDSNIRKAQERAAMLQRDIKLVDALLDVKDKINNRLQAIEKLDRHRSAWVRLLQEVAATVPDFVWLAELREKPEVRAAATPAERKTSKPNEPVQTQVQTATADTLPSYTAAEIEGHAFTLNAVAAFMIGLMRSDYFDKVELVSTQETKFADNEKAYNFVISCNIHYLSDEELQKMVAQADEQDSTLNEADFEEAQYEPPTTPAPANQQ